MKALLYSVSHIANTHIIHDRATIKLEETAEEYGMTTDELLHTCTVDPNSFLQTRKEINDMGGEKAFPYGRFNATDDVMQVLESEFPKTHAVIKKRMDMFDRNVANIGKDAQDHLRTMRWVTFCRVFFIFEAAFAAVLNLYVLVTVWRRRIDSNASTYRIGITVVCLSAIVQSLLQCFTVTIHQIHDNVYTLVQLGAVGWIRAREACILATQTLTFLMWEWIPAACILQYLALCRSHYSAARRLFIAYTYCLVIICVSSPFGAVFINEKTWVPYVHGVVREVQGMAEDEPVYAYAATMNLVPENNNRTIIPFVLVATLPSYVWSYGAFIVTTVLIYRALRTDGVQLTQRTLTMQRRFLRMQILQGFVPLFVCGFPVTLFIGNIVAGTSMDRSTIMMTASIFAVPIVQALVSLTFVRRMKRKAESESSSSTARRASSRVAH
ncbi:hypothetical protein PRIPAC_89694 [Pristionchus pacificus]|uniref:G protein-coupled receptor n=1 Tax=Pristionchus pacificus TaxID=54126 RepID=A0A2A6CW95_PRIPA|nr:hypothetical protein PRIPAC_89694 [Pristionchus pacificus]|eukprot:PDM82370.1 G protein-coupled receptor [Pristionchus pacificus]